MNNSDEPALIFAPHNDDEILATGGIIQRCREAGSTVKVVIVTNGDGQRRRPNFVPRLRADFVKLGYRRQNESLEALKYLDLEENDVYFLGYPDRGLSSMWTTNWNCDNLYYSKFTKTDHSPYDNSYTPNAPYCGSRIIEDMEEILQKVKPGSVYLPHPNDRHPDHWATNGLVLYALERLKAEEHHEFNDVAMLTYLVHSVRFPWPRGQFLEETLGKPENLESLDTKWQEIELNLGERVRKLRAIGKYRTQNQLMRKYLISFARATELFGIVPTLHLDNFTIYKDTHNISRDFVLNEDDEEPLISYLNPKRKSRLATLRRYPDIESVSLTKQAQGLQLDINFFNRYRPGNEIQINFKPLSFKKEDHEARASQLFQFRNNKLYHDGKEISQENGYSYQYQPDSCSLSIPLEKLGYPNRLILSITLARKGSPFARSANRLVELG